MMKYCSIMKHQYVNVTGAYNGESGKSVKSMKSMRLWQDFQN